MERIKGSRHNTLVNIVNEYMGSQWALFMPTLSMSAVDLFMHEKITVFFDDCITNTFELDNGSDFLVVGFNTTIDNFDLFLIRDDEV